jgi:hypothetical protein
MMKEQTHPAWWKSKPVFAPFLSLDPLYIQPPQFFTSKVRSHLYHILGLPWPTRTLFSGCGPCSWFLYIRGFVHHGNMHSLVFFVNAVEPFIINVHHTERSLENGIYSQTRRLGVSKAIFQPLLHIFQGQRWLTSLLHLLNSFSFILNWQHF